MLHPSVMVCVVSGRVGSRGDLGQVCYALSSMDADRCGRRARGLLGEFQPQPVVQPLGLLRAVLEAQYQKQSPRSKRKHTELSHKKTMSFDSGDSLLTYLVSQNREHTKDTPLLLFTC